VGCACVFAESPREVFCGVNVENASYGLTQCAERAAICAGVSAGFRRLSVLSLACCDKDNNPIRCFYPCGACLQVIAEFASSDTLIVLDQIGEFKLADLLRVPFVLNRAAMSSP
jgi:cytidine deaminase